MDFVSLAFLVLWSLSGVYLIVRADQAFNYAMFKKFPLIHPNGPDKVDFLSSLVFFLMGLITGPLTFSLIFQSLAYISPNDPLRSVGKWIFCFKSRPY